jgi:hypothetical protein
MAVSDASSPFTDAATITGGRVVVVGAGTVVVVVGAGTVEVEGSDPSGANVDVVRSGASEDEPHAASRRTIDVTRTEVKVRCMSRR